MNIQITSRHAKASASLQDAITGQLEALERFYDKITSFHVILDTDGLDKTIEIVANVQGKSIIAKAKAENTPTVVAAGVEKMEHQLKKLNEMVKDHKDHKNHNDEE